MRFTLVRSIAARFLLVVAAFAVAFSGFAIYCTWSQTEEHTQRLLANQAELALQFDLAIRAYVSETIRPFAEQRVQPDEFVPEVMSTSYVARGIFDKVRARFPEYVIKFSSDDPRNPANRAGPEERAVLDYFRAHPEIETWSGPIRMNGRLYRAHFSARRMEAQCLRCHGNPEDAPQSLRQRYGDQAGFRRAVGEVIAMDTVAIPADEFATAARSQTIRHSLVLLAGLALLAAAVHAAFNLLVGRRLARVSAHLQAAAQTEEGLPTPLPQPGADEIGVLVQSYNALVERFRGVYGALEDRVQARTRELAAALDREKAVASRLTTTLRELELATAAAQAANKAKSEFLANMSHEIRTPMTAILGYADVLLEHLGSDAPAEPTLAAETIKRNGEYLLTLINDILDLSKIEAGKMAADRLPCSVCQIVAEVMSLLRVRADAKGLALEAEYLGPVPETILTDPTRLRQILTNLLGNAIKFTEAGSVRLVIQYVPADPQPLMQFDVVDTGLGMSPQQVERLFQPFSQVDPSTTRRFGGTGLGLTICRRLVTMLGGSIGVLRSVPGAGTTFRFTVSTGLPDGQPMVEDPRAATAVAARDRRHETGLSRRALAGRRILLAEDGPDNQRLISLFLRQAGAEVALVENGRLAIEAALAAAAAQAPFDAILMDMQMPVLSGYEATRELRRRGYRGKIIALTAHAMAQDEAKCLAAGCDAYASKPIHQQVLIATLVRHIAAAGCPVR